MRAFLMTVTLLASAAVGQSAVGQEIALRIGVQNERPPFSYSDVDGELQGFDVEITWALCATLKVQCEVVALDFTAVIPALQGGRIDAAVASISITEQRRKLVDFTEKYFQTENRFVARVGTFSDISLDDMAGKTIGVKRGTTHERYLSDVYADAVLIRRYSHADEIYIDLALGRLDLAFSDAISFTESFLGTALGKDFHFVGPALSDPEWFGYGEGIAVRKGNAELLARLNHALQRILADGTFAEIRDQFFDYDIEGDDASVAQPIGAAGVGNDSEGQELPSR
jgi:arginine/ornithine transport system substrate-binding protein